MNRYYLRSLQTETGHQASLAKYERVNSFAKGCGREAFGHSGIDNNNAWPRPDLPAAAFTQIIEIASMHKEQGVSELLDPGLQAVRGGDCFVVAHRVPVRHERSLAHLATPDETAFYDIWENKHCHGRTPNPECCGTFRI